MCPFGGSEGYDACGRGAWADYPCATEYRYICEKWWNAAVAPAGAFGGGGH